MPRDGSGAYTRPSNSFSSPVLGTPISPTDAETLFDDIETAISDSAIKTPTYVTLVTNASLPNERVLTAGTGITITDAGAGSTVTVALTAQTQSFVTLGTSADLTNERVLTAGANISLTDNGPGSTLVIASSGGGGSTLSAPQGRVSLTTGVAVPTTDVTGATSHYYTPGVGKYVPVTTDGVNFAMTVFSEMSQATTDNTKSPAAVANNSLYDIFVWSDGGTLRATRGPAWSSGTSRGTGAGTSEIDFGTDFPTNNVDITNGPAANMGVLVATVRSNGSAQLVDTKAQRWVSNAYNAVPRPLVVREATNDWPYSTGTWRQTNGSTANQFDIVQCLGGGYAEAYAQSFVSSTSGDHYCATAIFLDTVHATDIDANCITSPIVTTAASRPTFGGAKWSGQLPAGRSLLIWAERGHGAGTQTWQGDNGGTLGQAGMLGSVYC